MFSYHQARLALRARALTLSVATTGSTTLSATATGYARSSGSFITDGFAIGMEVTGSGFSAAVNNTGGVITAVTATALTVDGPVSEAAASGRTLTVGLPTRRAWENSKFTPTTGFPYVEEQLIPGPTFETSIGPGSTLEMRPLYALQVHVPEDTNVGAPDQYADAIIALFPPRQAMTLTNGDVLRVRGDTGPFRGQLLKRKPGWAVVPVTVPLRLYTLNSD